MKTLFIEAIKKEALNAEKLKELEKILPHTIYIAYSIQFRKLAEQIKKHLEIKAEENKTKILGFSQILGCSELKTTAESILLIGEARFHALNLAISAGKEVIIFDNHSISKITNEEIEKYRKLEKGKYLKFLSSERIGVLVSTKAGQNNIKLAENLKKTLESKGKKAFLFISGNITVSELENFPDIEIWVNTACPGISLDSKKIINHKKILEN